MRLKDQFKNVAKLNALSFIISALYSHTIGPEENSKNEIKRRTQTIIPIESWLNENAAKVNNKMAIAALPKSIRIFLPKNTKRIKPIIEVTKLTIPINAVMKVAVKLSPLKIIFE